MCAACHIKIFKIPDMSENKSNVCEPSVAEPTDYNISVSDVNQNSSEIYQSVSYPSTVEVLKISIQISKEISQNLMNCDLNIVYFQAPKILVVRNDLNQRRASRKTLNCIPLLLHRSGERRRALIYYSCKVMRFFVCA